MENKSTYGLRLDQMAGLFAMGIDQPEATDRREDDEILRDLLHEQLTCVEPKNSLLLDTLVMMIDRSGDGLTMPKDRPLGEILLDPQSDLRLLGAIKDASKTLSCTLDSRTETALAKVVYFASIAAALIYHDTKITTIPDATLAESLDLLNEKHWMDSNLVALFSQVSRICRNRSNEA